MTTAYNTTDINSKQHLQPFFSIIITTYNRAHIIKRALDSLISQSENDWEAVVVDDESSDDTYLKILPYLKSKHKISYLRKIHSGESLSKNAGISLSKGKFISFLDSDDEYSPAHLFTRKTILLENPSVRFLYGGVKIIGSQFVPDRYNYKKKINLNECVIGGTFFIEKGTLGNLGGFHDIYLGTDADLFDRALKAGVTIKETDFPTYIYHRENEDSITNMLIKNIPEAGRVYSDINLK